MSETAAISTDSSGLQMQFMKLLVAQLQNQNPLEPMDNGDMTAQLAQISSLEQLEAINGHLSDLRGEAVGFGAALGAASLIGRQVTYTQADGTAAAGRATGVVQTDGTFALVVGDHVVGLDAVLGIEE